MRRIALAVVLALTLVAAALPAQAPTPPFFFIQLSDPQFGMFTADKAFDQETANFEFAVATVNRLKPAFVVITGDLVNKPGDGPQMAEYDRIRARISRDIPVYEMAGNHDIENEPTPETIAAYEKRYGPDRYVFTRGTFTGIVLNSTVIHTPTKVGSALAAQEAWLRAQLTDARASGAKHIVIFQHHPWFLAKADEEDGYFNIPRVRRDPLLALFHASGVKLLVSGHYHQNSVATDGDLEMVTTGPVGKPLGTAKSGIRVFLVTDAGITHRYFEFGDLPTTIDPSTGRLGAAPAGAQPAGAQRTGGQPSGAQPARGRGDAAAPSGAPGTATAPASNGR